MNYGYVRVSSKEQNLNRQYDALQKVYPDIKIFEDKESGKNFNRPGYKALIKALKPGDILFIQDLDRLGRNYDEIIIEWNKITKDIKAHIAVVNIPILDTRNNVSAELTGMLFTDIILRVLAYFSQREREMLRQRQREGIDAAKKRGQTFGAKRKMEPGTFAFLYEDLCIRQKIPKTQAAKIMGIAYSTFLIYIKEYEELNQSNKH